MDQTIRIERRPQESATAFDKRCRATIAAMLPHLKSTVVGKPTFGFSSRSCVVVLTLAPPAGAQG